MSPPPLSLPKASTDTRSLRPIAPVAKRAEEVSMPASVPVDPYAGSCNPPRRAKRPRSDSATASVAQAPRPPVRAEKQAPSIGDSADEDDGTPAPVATTPARRGRKPGTLSRAAREAQRKMNHSLIEKARRTKINDALATLRTLVPSDYGHGDEEAEAASRKSKREEKEKEFKLEVLIRTVSYLEELTAKVKMLEGGGCAECARRGAESASSLGGAAKRKRVMDTDSQGAPSVSQKVIGEPRKDGTSPGPALSASPTPRLPSIASWLPHVTAHPSDVSAAIRQPDHSASHLPSPPSSSKIRAETNMLPPPTLVLPSPNHSNILPRASPTSLHSPLTPTAWSSRSKCSPTFSPVRTPEDESAASLLLQISSSSFVPPAHSASAEGKPGLVPRTIGMQAQTPSSLLGLGQSERHRK